MSIFYPSDTRRFVHLYIGLFLCGSLSGQWLQDNWRRWCPTRADCVALCGTSLSPSLLCSIGTQQQQCIRASLLPHIPIDSLLLIPCSSLLSHLSLYPPKRLIFINRSRESQQKERRWLKGNISFLTYAQLLILSFTRLFLLPLLFSYSLVFTHFSLIPSLMFFFLFFFFFFECFVSHFRFFFYFSVFLSARSLQRELFYTTGSSDRAPCKDVDDDALKYIDSFFCFFFVFFFSGRPLPPAYIFVPLQQQQQQQQQQ